MYYNKLNELRKKREEELRIKHTQDSPFRNIDEFPEIKELIEAEQKCIDYMTQLFNTSDPYSDIHSFVSEVRTRSADFKLNIQIHRRVDDQISRRVDDRIHEEIIKLIILDFGRELFDQIGPLINTIPQTQMIIGKFTNEPHIIEYRICVFFSVN